MTENGSRSNFFNQLWVVNEIHMLSEIIIYVALFNVFENQSVNVSSVLSIIFHISVYDIVCFLLA